MLVFFRCPFCECENVGFRLFHAMRWRCEKHLWKWLQIEHLASEWRDDFCSGRNFYYSKCISGTGFHYEGNDNSANHDEFDD